MMYRNAVGEPSHGDRQRAQKLVKFGRAVFGRPADRTIGRAFGTLCRLSVVCNVLYCGETVRPSEKLSEGVNRKPGSKVDFLGHRHISTSGFATTATKTAIFALFLTIHPSNRYYMVQIDFLATNHVLIIGLCGQN